MTTLTDFLLARIAEDEAVVAEAGNLGTLQSELSECDTYAYRYHIAVSRVLAECEAKRRIVELHAPVPVHGCIDADGDDRWQEGPCLTLCLLALPYADHPHFQEAWRV